MSNVLTGQAISATFAQLLHMGGALSATEAVVRSGAGVASVMSLSTVSAAFSNIRLQGSTISTITANSDLVLAPNGTGSVRIAKAAITGGTISGLSAPVPIASGGTGGTTQATARDALGLGSIATQSASNVAITGGTITGVSLTGAFTFSTLTVTASFQAANIGITGNTIAAANANGNIELAPAGTGQVLFKKKAGYSGGVGLGSSVTQITSKSTAVTCNALVGDITTHDASLGGGASVSFQVNNSFVEVTDVIIINHVDLGTLGEYRIMIDRVRAGSFDITITNAAGGPLAEAIKIRFLVMHGAIT